MHLLKCFQQALLLMDERLALVRCDIDVVAAGAQELLSTKVSSKSITPRSKITPQEHDKPVLWKPDVNESCWADVRCVSTACVDSVGVHEHLGKLHSNIELVIAREALGAEDH